MTFATELVCESCGAAFPTDQPILLCRRCAGLLDAHYDYAAIKSALRLDDILKRRPTVWRWREFLPIREERHQVDIGAGGSPLIPCPRLAEWVGAGRLYVKYDGMQPTASLKDRSFAVAVSKAMELGVRDVITYSSGNAAASLAAHTSRAGMRGLILVNAWAEEVKLLFLSSFSLSVVRLNWSSFEEVEALMAHAVHDLHLHSFVNFQNPWRHEGNKTYAFEIWWDLDQDVPDHEIHPIGTGGGIFGAYKGYRELIEVGLSERMPQLHGTQPAACQALVTAFKGKRTRATPEGDPKSTIAEAIANDVPLDGGFRPLRAIYESNGRAVAVTDQEMLDGVRLLGTEGISAEPAGATTAWAARRLHESGVIKGDDTVVCVVTASGLKQPTALAQIDHSSLPTIDATADDLDGIIGQLQK
jgi:threonine synthase